MTWRGNPLPLIRKHEVIIGIIRGEYVGQHDNQSWYILEIFEAFEYI